MSSCFAKSVEVTIQAAPKLTVLNAFIKRGSGDEMLDYPITNYPEFEWKETHMESKSFDFSWKSSQLNSRFQVSGHSSTHTDSTPRPRWNCRKGWRTLHGFVQLIDHVGLGIHFRTVDKCELELPLSECLRDLNFVKRVMQHGWAKIAWNLLFVSSRPVGVKTSVTDSVSGPVVHPGGGILPSLTQPATNKCQKIEAHPGKKLLTRRKSFSTRYHSDVALSSRDTPRSFV